MTDKELLRLAKKIMRKLKGWSTDDMREDARDFPEAHQYELEWLVEILKGIK